MRRLVHVSRDKNLCASCARWIEAEPTDADALPDGQWVNQGGIQVYIEAPTPPKKPIRKLSPCGTLAAYRRHLKNREVPCEPCSEASRIYTRRRRGIADPLPLQPHGTHAAFARHYAARTIACDDCWAAERAYQRDAKRRRRAQLRERKAA